MLGMACVRQILPSQACKVTKRRSGEPGGLTRVLTRTKPLRLVRKAL
jgi:hypothetical protein